MSGKNYDSSVRLVFRRHAYERMSARRITENDIQAALSSGEIIEDYPDDTPYPSRLILGRSGGRSIHVVIAENKAENEAIVITVYEPDRDKWDQDLKRRKS